MASPKRGTSRSATARYPTTRRPRGIGGVLATVHEITQKVVGERRVVILRDLGARAGTPRPAPRTPVDFAAPTFAATARTYRSRCFISSIPTAGMRGWQARRESNRAQGASPLVVALDLATGPWPRRPLAAASHVSDVTVTDLGARFDVVPAGPWTDPPHSAVVVPVRSNKAHELGRVAGAGPQRAAEVRRALSRFLRARRPSRSPRPSPMRAPTRKSASAPKRSPRSIAPRRHSSPT